ncbi:MAG: 6-bladed beta-propeller [Desulfuromonadia bacterium]
MMRRLLFALLLFMAGCSTVPPFEFRDQRVSVVWPPPPEPVRIRYLSQLYGASDLELPKRKVESIIGKVIGENPLGTDFITPSSISTHALRYLIVADPAARAVHWFDMVEREVVPIRSFGETLFRSPVSVSFAPDGSFYVADSDLKRVFHFSARLEPKGELTGVSFSRPAGMAVTGDGEVVVADVLAHRLLVFDPTDHYRRSIPSSDGDDDLNRPVAVTIDRQKTVYVSDSLNFRVVQYDWDGNRLRAFGEPGDTPGYISRPKGIAVDSEGHVYLVDSLMNIVQIFTPRGDLLLPFGGEGKKAGQFTLPSGIHIDGKDRIFVADTYNRRIQVFQYVKDGLR